MVREITVRPTLQQIFQKVNPVLFNKMSCSLLLVLFGSINQTFHAILVNKSAPFFSRNLTLSSFPICAVRATAPPPFNFALYSSSIDTTSTEAYWAALARTLYESKKKDSDLDQRHSLGRI